MALTGAGSGRIGAGLGVPAATVRGWLRQAPLRRRGDAPGRDAPAELPAGQVAARDALNAVAACTHAAITRFGLSRTDLWPLLGRFGLARHLAPARCRLILSRQPGHRYARGPAATLTMTTAAPFPALTASS